MAFKFVCFFALLAVANAGLIQPAVTYAAPYSYADHAVGSTQENVVRSLHGTVSHYSKSVDTPYSSVTKTDTRINNNVYTPTLTKTIAYASPAPVTVHHESHAAPVTYTHAAHPVTYTHAAPVTYAHAAPVVAKTVYSAPAPVTYTHAAPAVYSSAVAKTVYTPTYTHAAPVTKTLYTAPVAKAVYAAPTYTHAVPVAKTVYADAHPAVYAASHATPVAAQYATKTVSYSPASAVAHVNFDGLGVHYGW